MMEFVDFDEVSEQVDLPENMVHYIAMKIDVTPYFDEGSQKKYKTIYEVVVFNQNSRTFCCSTTPSYWMIHVGYTVSPETYESMTEEDIEDMDDFFWNCDLTSDSFYMNVRDVERMMQDNPSCWVTMGNHNSNIPYQYEDDNDAVEDYHRSPYF
jgi:hypothetical protein